MRGDGIETYKLLLASKKRDRLASNLDASRPSYRNSLPSAPRTLPTPWCRMKS